MGLEGFESDIASQNIGKLIQQCGYLPVVIAGYAQTLLQMALTVSRQARKTVMTFVGLPISATRSAPLIRCILLLVY